ncbi:adenylyltransferase/cytidyltransferase family protein [Candidatus Sumerlaeota bacterium]|nr:adenylyltransferase/cytidyltransferase family protein [Candidatus Sumerlaeota bacterium]
MKNAKLKTLDELKSIVSNAKADGKTVVLTNGCFDILHGGHISYLESAKALGDILIVAVNSDESVRRIKDERRPIIPQDERVELLSEIECVDFILLFDEPTCDHLLRELRPDYHAKGTDYTRESVPERPTAQKLGIETVIVGNSKENATKDIIAEIIKRYGNN